MSKDISQYLHYYLGCDWQVTQLSGEFASGAYGTSYFNSLLLRELALGNVTIKPILRKLESMTEEEMMSLLLCLIPDDMEDKPDADEHDLEMFYNDGGLFVDDDVAVGANYSCRCYEGQIAVTKCGDINLYNEDGKQERVFNQIAGFHYLLSRGFWLFGNDWFDEGIIIDKDKR